MRKPNLSFPVERKLLQAIEREKRRLKLSRADVVRQILYRHYGWGGLQRSESLDMVECVKGAE